MKLCIPLYTLFFLSSSSLIAADGWRKHVVTEAGRNMTAVGADFSGDGEVDVITSYGGKISLFTAPDWNETVIHRLEKPNATCIHSETFDIDGDGDTDMAIVLYGTDTVNLLVNDGNGVFDTLAVRNSRATPGGSSQALVK